MKKELKDKLFKDFPQLYGDDVYDFSIGDGWENIVRYLSHELVNLINKNPDLEIKVCQVKEKFGQLRFYISFISLQIESNLCEQVYFLISFIENKSLQICEYCGNEGSIDKSKGWLKTLCDDCKINRINIENEIRKQYEEEWKKIKEKRNEVSNAKS